jgi:AbrB family looped-hinge helix DNA binding protein
LFLGCETPAVHFVADISLIPGRIGGKFLPMTVVHMSEKGQIVVPKEIRDQRGFGNGSAFAVVQTRSGAIVFRPILGKPKLDLVEHLLRLKGLDIPEMKFHGKPRV